MNKSKMWLSLIFILALHSCGLPDTPDIPAPPIAIDDDDEDNELAFRTPSDSKIDRYIIWYKIYPNISPTETETLVADDYTYFTDLGIVNASDISKKDFHELQLSADVDDGYFFRDIAAETEVTIARIPTNTIDYIQVSVSGKTHNVRRDVAVAAADNARKPFYDKFDLSSDTDIRSRKSSDFSEYGNLDRGFSVAFMAQSAYVDGVELSLISSVLTPVGIIYSSEGFENN